MTKVCWTCVKGFARAVYKETNNSILPFQKFNLSTCIDEECSMHNLWKMPIYPHWRESMPVFKIREMLLAIDQIIHHELLVELEELLEILKDFPFLFEHHRERLFKFIPA